MAASLAPNDGAQNIPLQHTGIRETRAWEACVKFRGEEVSLGLFRTCHEAVMWRDRSLIALIGANADTMYPIESYIDFIKHIPDNVGFRSPAFGSFSTVTDRSLVLAHMQRTIEFLFAKEGGTGGPVLLSDASPSSQSQQPPSARMNQSSPAIPSSEPRHLGQQQNEQAMEHRVSSVPEQGMGSGTAATPDHSNPLSGDQCVRDSPIPRPADNTGAHVDSTGSQDQDTSLGGENTPPNPATWTQRLRTRENRMSFASPSRRRRRSSSSPTLTMPSVVFAPPPPPPTVYAPAPASELHTPSSQSQPPSMTTPSVAIHSSPHDSGAETEMTHSPKRRRRSPLQDASPSSCSSPNTRGNSDVTSHSLLPAPAPAEPHRPSPQPETTPPTQRQIDHTPASASRGGRRAKSSPVVESTENTHTKRTLENSAFSEVLLKNSALESEPKKVVTKTKARAAVVDKSTTSAKVIPRAELRKLASGKGQTPAKGRPTPTPTTVVRGPRQIRKNQHSDSKGSPNSSSRAGAGLAAPTSAPVSTIKPLKSPQPPALTPTNTEPATMPRSKRVRLSKQDKGGEESQLPAKRPLVSPSESSSSSSSSSQGHIRLSPIPLPATAASLIPTLAPSFADPDPAPAPASPPPQSTHTLPQAASHEQLAEALAFSSTSEVVEDFKASLLQVEKRLTDTHGCTHHIKRQNQERWEAWRADLQVASTVHSLHKEFDWFLKNLRPAAIEADELIMPLQKFSEHDLISVIDYLQCAIRWNHVWCGCGQR